MRAEANFSNPPLTNPFNAAQLPALSVCNGLSAEGLPLSMQIVGRPFDEATVLRVGHAYERASAWREQRPQLQPGEASSADPVNSDANLADLDAASVQRYRSRAQAAGLELDDQQLADLCQAMPHLEAMIAQLPRERDYARSPGPVFSW
jgi:aspartyl-tRNA(Asn)/glutamyl-tRNA(Gln) amidotransferase subunit A